MKEIIKNAPKEAYELTEDEIKARRQERNEKRKQRLEEEERERQKKQKEEDDLRELQLRCEENKENEKIDMIFPEMPVKVVEDKSEAKSNPKSSDSNSTKKSKKKKSDGSTAKKKKRKKVNQDSTMPLMVAGSTGLPTFFFNKIENSVSVFQGKVAQKKFYFKQISSKQNDER